MKARREDSETRYFIDLDVQTRKVLECVTDMAYLLHDASGSVEVFQDRHVTGLFPRAVWLELIAAAGFEPIAVRPLRAQLVQQHRARGVPGATARRFR